jgi:iron(III) transport system substrate-binding protein
MKKILMAMAGAAVSFGAAAQGQVNVICSVQAEWCNMIGTVYGKTTGTKINISMKGSGEALAQLIAEKDNPKTDIWFGGTGDPHLQAAESGPVPGIQIATLPQLQGWAQQQAAAVQVPHGGHLLGPAGLWLQHRAAGQEKAARAKDLERPAQPRPEG